MSELRVKPRRMLGVESLELMGGLFREQNFAALEQAKLFLRAWPSLQAEAIWVLCLFGNWRDAGTSVTP